MWEERCRGVCVCVCGARWQAYLCASGGQHSEVPLSDGPLVTGLHHTDVPARFDLEWHSTRMHLWVPLAYFHNRRLLAQLLVGFVSVCALYFIFSRCLLFSFLGKSSILHVTIQLWFHPPGVLFFHIHVIPCENEKYCFTRHPVHHVNGQALLHLLWEALVSVLLGKSHKTFLSYFSQISKEILEIRNVYSTWFILSLFCRTLLHLHILLIFCIFLWKKNFSPFPSFDYSN